MLQLKIRPGTRISIGDDIFLEIALDPRDRWALRISAPTQLVIRRIEEPGGVEAPPEQPKI